MRTFTLLILSLSIFIFAPGDSNAQNSFQGEFEEITITGDSVWSTFYDHIKLNNLSGQPLDLKWVRIESIGPANWVTSVCDPIVCHDELADSSTFTLPANVGLSDYINVHFYPNGQGGAGRVKVRVENVNDKGDFIILTYNGTTNGSILPADTTTEDSVNVGISILEKDQMIAYPNPFNHYLILDGPQKRGNKMIIRNIEGKTMMTQSMAENQSRIATSNLETGIYYISIVDQKGTTLKVSKLIKAE